MKIVLHFFN